MIERWGGFVARRALAVLLAGIVVALRGRRLRLRGLRLAVQGGFDDPDSESAREREAEQDTFGNQSVDVVAIYSNDELTADYPEFRAAVEDVVAGLPGDAVTAVVPYYDAAGRAGPGQLRRALRAGPDLAGGRHPGRRT